MFELEPDSYAIVLPIYERARMDFPLIRAVLRGVQPGNVFVDDREAPNLVLAANRFGFTYLFGDTEHEELVGAVMDSWLADARLKNRYLLWYDPPLECRRRMDSMLSSGARKRLRIQFEFQKGSFPGYAAESSLPPDVEIVKVGEQALPELESFGLDLGRRFWSSEEDFLRYGVGFAARMGGNFASLCYSACVVDQVAEIDVATLQEFRGHGLAKFVSAAFIDYCLAHSMTPNWDCFDYNEPSRKLAGYLGFREHRQYVFYSLNT